MIISDYILYLIDDYQLSPREINNGLCADIADEIWRKFPIAKVLSDKDMGSPEYTHSFIYYLGKFYDVECPNGITNWKELPIFNRQLIEKR